MEWSDLKPSLRVDKEQWETPPTRAAFLDSQPGQLFCGHKPYKSKFAAVGHSKYIMWLKVPSC